MKQGYDSYKPSGIDWIGEIRSHWNVCRFQYALGAIMDGTHFSPEPCENGYPYITAADVRGVGLNYDITKKISESDYTALVQAGCKAFKDDVLLVKDGATTGRVGYKDDDDECVTLSSVAMLRGSKSVDSKYLMHYIAGNFLQHQIIVAMAGAAMPRITLEKINAFWGIFPPLAEQKAIAAWLDTQCGEIDSAIAKVDREIELIDELKQSEISRVVTRGLNPDVPLRPSGIDWIGDVPEHWKIAPIKYSFRIISGATPKTEKPEYWDGDISWITPADYKSDDHYVKHGRKNITKEGLSSCTTEIVPKHSLIFSKRAPIGTVALAAGALCTNQGCISCVPNAQTNSNYFYYLCRTATCEFEILGSGATFLEISSTNFANFPMPLPPLSEQQAIANYLDKKCAKIDGLKEKLVKKRETLKELRQAIISEVVTGKRKVI